MKNKLYTLILAAFSFGFIGCKTASKMYEKGHYDEAVSLAAKKLQKKPDDAKLIDIIRSSYSYALKDHEDAIHADLQSANELRFEWIYNEYAALQRLYDAIYKVPDIYQLVKPNDYSSQLVQYAGLAADVRYNRGMALMRNQDRQSFRNAYHEFKTGLGFAPGDLNIRSAMDQAYEGGVTNVVFLPAEEDNGFRFSNYNAGMHSVEDDLIRNLRNGNNNEFVRFLTPWEAQSKNLHTDMVVNLRMRNFDLGRVQDFRSSRKVSKEVVIKEKQIRPDSVVREYGKVFAEITTTTRNMQSSAMMMVDIRDANGDWLWNDNISASHTWSTVFASFTGDARALDENDKQLLNKPIVPEPSRDEIIRCLSDQISNDALWRLRNYFSHA